MAAYYEVKMKTTEIIIIKLFKHYYYFKFMGIKISINKYLYSI